MNVNNEMMYKKNFLNILAIKTEIINFKYCLYVDVFVENDIEFKSLNGLDSVPNVVLNEYSTIIIKFKDLKFAMDFPFDTDSLKKSIELFDIYLETIKKYSENLF